MIPVDIRWYHCMGPTKRGFLTIKATKSNQADVYKHKPSEILIRFRADAWTHKRGAYDGRGRERVESDWKGSRIGPREEYLEIRTPTQLSISRLTVTHHRQHTPINTFISLTHATSSTRSRGDLYQMYAPIMRWHFWCWPWGS
jgi:hypothetical protein